MQLQSSKDEEVFATQLRQMLPPTGYNRASQSMDDLPAPDLLVESRPTAGIGAEGIP